MDTLIVLIPSPLNGPLVWAPVSRALRMQGIQTLVIELEDDPDLAVPYWVQHAASVARKVAHLEPERRVTLAGHSGAGPLLPAIGAFSPHPIGGYVFVDAGLPIPGQSRLQELETILPEFGAELRRQLDAGERFPAWTDDEAREILPDEGLRHGILAELRPRDQAFFTELFPRFEAWPDAPCAYIRFSAAYDQPAIQARAQGWVYREFQAGHFHMVVDAEAVAVALFELMQGWASEFPL